MPPTSPTPFDITDIPYIAWVPSIYVWAGAFVITIAAALLGMALSRARSPGRKAGKLLAALLVDLERSSAGGTVADAQRALLLAKRIAAVTCEPVCAQMSPNELRQRAHRSAGPAEQALFTALAHLEETLYQPASPLRDSSLSEQLCSLGRLGSELVAAHTRGPQ